MARDVKIVIGTSNEVFESILPIDRVVTLDGNNMVSLADIQFYVPEELIERIIGE